VCEFERPYLVNPLNELGAPRDEGSRKVADRALELRASFVAPIGHNASASALPIEAERKLRL
jgi:hypothetical protein